MATSKIITIKQTLKKAIDYITNPDKTNNGQLVYSYGCSVPTADIEMEMTARQGSGRGNRIAYHLIQSFSPDDNISPKKALELGIEFAKKVTGGNFEFVVTTHTDKDHIHNHIIYNSVDYVNHRKYHSNKKDKYRIRDINDEICKANDLPVLPQYDGRRKSKYENIHKKEQSGWRDKLKKSIDHTISISASFDDFLFALEMEGYEIKRGKHIAFRAPGQERFIRAKSIGDSYTEEAIIERIENKDKEPVVRENHSSENNNRAVLQKKQKEKRTTFPKRVNLLVDISRNIKAQQSKGYEQALVRSNINTLVKTMNFLIERKITTPDDFQAYVDGKLAEYSFYKRDVQKLEEKLFDLSEKIKFTQNYKKNAPVYFESKRAKNRTEFARNHGNQIAMFKASEIYFERKNLNPKELSLTELFEEYKRLKEEKTQMGKRSNSLKGELSELDRVAQNIEKALGVHFEGNAVFPNTKRKERKSREEDVQK